MTRAQSPNYFRPMPQRNIHRNVAKAGRLNAIDDALQLRGMPVIALILVLVLLITTGGAG
ncbi:MAG TPA: hypothetical protein VFI81_01850 [Rhodanobacteraceae bacterium]|nr:hypothetical protein [Rhodanobacteraceae bacterium]